jgi:electron transport complex protein RnfD
MKLVVSSSPHWHGKLTVNKIHYNFIVALLPAVIFAIFNYGMHAARVMALAVATAMIADIIIRLLFRKTVTAADGSAILIGLLFALILPPSVPFWLVIIGSFLCILIGKEIFGGLGSNPLNPVLVGWAILHISWPGYLNFNLAAANYNLDFPLHYPLTMLKNGGTELISDFTFLDLLLGKQVGGMGAAAILFILIGGIYLLLRKIISWEIPLSFAAGIVVMSFIFWLSNSATYANPLFHLLTGNVMIGMFFLATDYSSSPFNRWGMIVFGLGCGILTIILRAWSVYPDGVLFSILIMNLFTPLFDRIKNKPKPLEIYHIERR